jgi:hypothetical protein
MGDSQTASAMPETSTPLFLLNYSRAVFFLDEGDFVRIFLKPA